MASLPASGDPPLLIHTPACSKCRGIHAELTARGIAFAERAYREDPLVESELLELFARLVDPPADLVRWNDAQPGQLAVGPDASVPDLARALSAHPALLQRPVLVVGSRAAIGRPPARALALLDSQDGGGSPQP